MTSPRRSMAPRDQDVSTFSAPILRLHAALAAHCVALVDGAGETVDYAGTVDPYEVRVTAAEWQLVLNTIRSCSSSVWSSTREFYFRGTRRSYCAVFLAESYAVIVELPRHAFRVSHRALSEAVLSISLEAGFDVGSDYSWGKERWLTVEVRGEGQPERPRAIWLKGQWEPIEVLGRLASSELESGALGYRVHIASGAEFTLVRERLGHWYADELATSD